MCLEDRFQLWGWWHQGLKICVKNVGLTIVLVEWGSAILWEICQFNRPFELPKIGNVQTGTSRDFFEFQFYSTSSTQWMHVRNTKIHTQNITLRGLILAWKLDYLTAIIWINCSPQSQRVSVINLNDSSYVLVLNDMPSDASRYRKVVIKRVTRNFCRQVRQTFQSERYKEFLIYTYIFKVLTCTWWP